MTASAAKLSADVTRDEYRLTKTESNFAEQIATAVWLRRLTDEAAREALGAYALACHGRKPAHARLLAALAKEYHRCRERQDLCG
jgi:hypothetical protein